MCQKRFFYILRKTFFWIPCPLWKTQYIGISREFPNDFRQTSGGFCIMGLCALYLISLGWRLDKLPNWKFHPRKAVLYSYPTQTILIKSYKCFGLRPSARISTVFVKFIRTVNRRFFFKQYSG